MTPSETLADGHVFGIKWNPRFYLYNEEKNYTDASEGILGKLTSFMKGIFDNIVPETMDNGATDTVAEAISASKNSNNGVYSVYNSIYGNNQILTDSDGVWKFGVETGIEPEFNTENISTDISFTTVKNDKGEIVITPLQSNVAAACIFNLVVADGNGNTHSYIVNVAENSGFTIPTDIAAPFKAQIVCGTKASDIYSIGTDGTASKVTVASKKVLLTDSADNITDGKITVSGANATSSYDIFYSRENGAKDRTIKFNAKRGEKMRLGFTAPYAGYFEVSAPITVENDAVVYYSVSHEKNGTISKILTPLTKYSKNDVLCQSQLYLAKGDIVWFEAYSLTDSVINIGVPKLTSGRRFIENNLMYYNYSAINYIENAKGNGYTYAENTSAEKTTAAWSFGYFGEDKVLKPYTSINNGYYYTVAANGNKDSVGTLYPMLNSDTEIADKNSYNPSKLYGSVDSTTGIYMQFTAPIGGSGSLKLTDGVNAITGVKLTVLKNGEVLNTYADGVAAGTIVDFGVLSPMDVITLMYEGTASNCYFGSPSVQLGGGTVMTVNFINTEGKPLYSVSAAKLVIPVLNGFSGLCPVAWEKDGVEYSAGTEYTPIETTPNKTNNFVAKYSYYGDVNNDNKIDESNDYAKISEHIIKKSDLTVAQQGVSDIKTDGKVNISDLLRVQKFIKLGTYDAD